MTWLENLPTVFVGEKPLEQQCCYRIDKRLKTPDNVFDIFASNFWRGKVVTYSSAPVCPSKGSWHCSILYMAVTICAFLLYFFLFLFKKSGTIWLLDVMAEPSWNISREKVPPAAHGSAHGAFPRAPCWTGNESSCLSSCLVVLFFKIVITNYWLDWIKCQVCCELFTVNKVQ